MTRWSSRVKCQLPLEVDVVGGLDGCRGAHCHRRQLERSPERRGAVFDRTPRPGRAAPPAGSWSPGCSWRSSRTAAGWCRDGTPRRPAAARAPLPAPRARRRRRLRRASVATSGRRRARRRGASPRSRPPRPTVASRSCGAVRARSCGGPHAAGRRMAGGTSDGCSGEFGIGRLRSESYRRESEGPLPTRKKRAPLRAPDAAEAEPFQRVVLEPAIASLAAARSTAGAATAVPKLREGDSLVSQGTACQWLQRHRCRSSRRRSGGRTLPRVSA